MITNPQCLCMPFVRPLGALVCPLYAGTRARTATDDPRAQWMVICPCETPWHRIRRATGVLPHAQRQPSLGVVRVCSGRSQGKTITHNFSAGIQPKHYVTAAELQINPPDQQRLESVGGQVTDMRGKLVEWEIQDRCIAPAWHPNMKEWRYGDCQETRAAQLQAPRGWGMSIENTRMRGARHGGAALLRLHVHLGALASLDCHSICHSTFPILASPLCPRLIGQKATSRTIVLLPQHPPMTPYSVNGPSVRCPPLYAAPAGSSQDPKQLSDLVPQNV